MYGKNTKKEIYGFRDNVYRYNADFLNGKAHYCYTPFYSGSNGEYETYVYPRRKYPDETVFTTSVKPNDTLYFDPSSGYPRFKLGLTSNKRCIKVSKADAVVVSGIIQHKQGDDQAKTVFFDKDSDRFLIINTISFQNYFNSDEQKLIEHCIALGFPISSLEKIYDGLIDSFAKESLWIPNYLDGLYSVPLIKDNDLDKIICAMCQNVTLEEILSISDMLHSDDRSVVQLGIKMITGFDTYKYKLTFRMLLMSSNKGYDCSGNQVATKQLVSTLGLTQTQARYYTGGDFSSFCRFFEDENDTYTVEDIALAKQFASKMIQDHINRFYKDLVKEGYRGLPDSFKIKIE